MRARVSSEKEERQSCSEPERKREARQQEGIFQGKIYVVCAYNNNNNYLVKPYNHVFTRT